MIKCDLCNSSPNQRVRIYTTIKLNFNKLNNLIHIVINKLFYGEKR